MVAVALRAATQAVSQLQASNWNRRSSPAFYAFYVTRRQKANLEPTSSIHLHHPSIRGFWLAPPLRFLIHARQSICQSAQVLAHLSGPSLAHLCWHAALLLSVQLLSDPAVVIVVVSFSVSSRLSLVLSLVPSSLVPPPRSSLAFHSPSSILHSTLSTPSSLVSLPFLIAQSLTFQSLSTQTTSSAYSPFFPSSLLLRFPPFPSMHRNCTNHGNSRSARAAGIPQLL